MSSSTSPLTNSRVPSGGELSLSGHIKSTVINTINELIYNILLSLRHSIKLNSGLFIP